MYGRLDIYFGRTNIILKIVLKFFCHDLRILLLSLFLSLLLNYFFCDFFSISIIIIVIIILIILLFLDIHIPILLLLILHPLHHFIHPFQPVPLIIFHLLLHESIPFCSKLTSHDFLELLSVFLTLLLHILTKGLVLVLFV